MNLDEIVAEVQRHQLAKMESDVRGLTDRQLGDLRRAVNKETARRKRIAQKNNTWTANEGLETCLGASLDLLKKGQP
jgi:23S rRNA maturation mini-RNase III